MNEEPDGEILKLPIEAICHPMRSGSDGSGRAESCASVKTTANGAAVIVGLPSASKATEKFEATRLKLEPMLPTPMPEWVAAS